MKGSSDNGKLFSEFPSISTEQWEELIKKDLKGADYSKKLIWESPEGIKVKPYYRKEHLEEKEYLDSLPGEIPFNRGNKRDSNNWEIRQDIKLDKVETANQKSLFILDRGISSLGFRMSSSSDKSVLKDQSDFSRLLKDIYFDIIGLHFVCGYNSVQILHFINNEVDARKLDPENIHGSTDFDPLGYLTRTGHFNHDEKADFDELIKISKYAKDHLPNFKPIGINGYFLHNAGATVVQELAFSLAIAVEYISLLTDQGISADNACKLMQFNLGVGNNFFMEISKMRAVRYLWTKIAESFDVQNDESKKIFIHSFTSDTNKTLYDPYVNLLRATTEAMSAVIGGTDSLTVRPFDYIYKNTSKFSGRLARNIQIILKEESYLNRVNDPGGGSYYIENLTDSVIEESWKLFLHIEEEGGYLASLKKGIIQNQIKNTCDKRMKKISSGKEVLLGTNKYPNPRENVKHAISASIAFPEKPGQNNPIEPIPHFRGAESFEKLRLSVENRDKKPLVYLLTFGNLTMRNARADFSRNFFSCGGYQIIQNESVVSVNEGVEEAIKLHADIVVACSSDEEYEVAVPEIFKLLDHRAMCVVAGAPACMEDLKKTGVEYFIHMRSDILETLAHFNRELGVGA